MIKIQQQQNCEYPEELGSQFNPFCTFYLSSFLVVSTKSEISFPFFFLQYD